MKIIACLLPMLITVSLFLLTLTILFIVKKWDGIKSAFKALHRAELRLSTIPRYTWWTAKYAFPILLLIAYYQQPHTQHNPLLVVVDCATGKPLKTLADCGCKTFAP